MLSSVFKGNTVTGRDSIRRANCGGVERLSVLSWDFIGGISLFLAVNVSKIKSFFHQ